MSIAAISSDLRAATRGLEDLVLQCRPSSPIIFAARYFREERQGVRAAYLHALHALPFLLQRPNEFRSAACTVFCGKKGGGSSSVCGRGEISEVLRASLFGSGRSPGTSAEWEIDIVETVLKDFVNADALDFDAFVLVLRLHFSCWLLLRWAHVKVSEKSSFADTLTCMKR